MYSSSPHAGLLALKFNNTECNQCFHVRLTHICTVGVKKGDIFIPFRPVATTCEPVPNHLYISVPHARAATPIAFAFEHCVFACMHCVATSNFDHSYGHLRKQAHQSDTVDLESV